MQVRVLVPRRDESIDSTQNTAHDIEQIPSTRFVAYMNRSLHRLNRPPRVEHADEAVVGARTGQKRWWKRLWFRLWFLMALVIAIIIIVSVVKTTK